MGGGYVYTTPGIKGKPYSLKSYGADGLPGDPQRTPTSFCNEKDHGFSLLESLVGLTIIAMILLALLQIGRNSAAQVKRAEDATIAANLAKTIFSSAGVEYPLKPGTKTAN